MRVRRTLALAITCCLVFAVWSCSGDAASRAFDSIRADDMRFPVKFLSSAEFQGRSTPSAELDIASRYIALTAEEIGLKPLLPGGSYLQEVPVEVTTIVPHASGLRLFEAGRERTFAFPADVSAGRGFEAGRAAGEIVFAGYGVSAPGAGWDDLAGLDLKGKVVVVLDAVLPEDHFLRRPENRGSIAGRVATLRGRGAAAVVTVIADDREARLSEKALGFDLPEKLRFPDVVTGTGTSAAAGTSPVPPGATFLQVEVRHAAAAAILGCARDELLSMIAALRRGERVPAKVLRGRRLEIEIGAATREAKTFNVVAWLEGSDPALRGEYITITSHHDHNPSREGRVFPGADDNLSGVAGMFELAEALIPSKPRRSVIFVWNTAEERGLVGSYHFVQHCPVPVEKISANLDLDMISRNDPGMIYLIGSNALSSELDASIKAMNRKPGPELRLDYTYESPGHPDRFFFRSDQYPYIRYGIPAVWFFCGTTPDYHTEGDTEARVDYGKMTKVLRLAYRVAMDIAGRPGLLKLDVRRDVTSRGPANMAVAWQ